MEINQNFDAGNISVIDCNDASNIQLEINRDNNSEFFQWFYFRLSGVKNQQCTLNITNAKSAAYPLGFENYRVLYSYDRKEWCRHDTDLKADVLSIVFTSRHDSVYFAYFIPYSMERHHDLIANALSYEHCTHETIGKTLDGQDMDLLVFSTGDIKYKKNCWLIARQHPGETMSEWWMEGCIELLVDIENSQTQRVLDKCNVFIIPNMNPDGSRRGHLRTNAAGNNLNREWQIPSLEGSPEVFFVKEKMSVTGVDFLLDVHGDEALPYCFIAGTEGLKGWSKSRQAQLDFYKNRLAEVNTDFQTIRGYPSKAAGQANMTMSTAQIAGLHDCLAMTLEMPFKDTTATPDEKYGWSTLRCKRLGHSCLKVMEEFIGRSF